MSNTIRSLFIRYDDDDGDDDGDDGSDDDDGDDDDGSDGDDDDGRVVYSIRAASLGMI